MMETFVDWNAICLVCLQGGEMRSIFEKGPENIEISKMIMRCSDVTIQKGINLPEQICNSCFDDLNIAYRFRTNCESSSIVLKSFLNINSNIDINASSSNDNENRIKILVEPGCEIEKVTEIINDDNPIFNEDDCSEMKEGNLEDEQKRSKMVDIIEIKQDEDSQDISLESTDKTIEFVSMEDTSKYKKKMVEDKSKEINPKETPRVRKLFKKTKARKKSRSKPKVIKTDFEITAENVSSMIPSLTSVTYIPNKNNDKPQKICEICGNGYKYQHALDSHMRRHRNEKPFSCELCNRSFVANVGLKRHMRVHTGQKPYGCRHCNRRFSDYGSKIKHERTHTGERPYECATCGKTFGYAHVLSVHILSHTGEKKFKCETCEKAFTKKVYLIKHVNNFHPVKLQATDEIQIQATNSEPVEDNEENIIAEFEFDSDV